MSPGSGAEVTSDDEESPRVPADDPRNGLLVDAPSEGRFREEPAESSDEERFPEEPVDAPDEGRFSEEPVEPSDPSRSA